MAPSVAIIGAGLSGLSAAAHLRRRHAITATIFESLPRAGGRVHSIKVELPASRQSLVIDLGATWCHGTRGNSAYDLAVESGVVSDPRHAEDSPDHRDEDDGVWLFSAPAVVVSHGVARTVGSESLLPVVRAYGASLRKNESDSVRRCEEERDDEGVQWFLRRSTGFDDMSPLDRAVFRARDAFEACVNGCDSSTADLSLKRLSDYVTLKGDNVMLDGGMGEVVDTFVQQLQVSQLMLGRRVVRVAYGDENGGGVRITFEDGSVWSGDCIIWTPSINVTKRAVVEGVFEPRLPDEKVAAMNERVQGFVEKVFVFLNEALKNVTSDCSMPIIWEDSKAIPQSQQWFTNVFSVLYSSKHNVVSFWLTGEAAKHVCSLANDLQSEQVALLLTILYSQPITVGMVICSEWSLNQSTLGSYSYAKVRCTKDAVQTLAKPLPSADKPLVCFAGEATHQSFYSTMHGAIESGYREADRVAAFLSQQPLRISKSENRIVS
ncbi:unnamed protein product [Agarophyton chilense]|eukprot:gb/GEZJ01004349.1/.p1 GENE.gb/GEZJ01004349.1/~~gb/GEZJ01004349.1/.p1  ORF type:complete len:492 (+),score=56.28 gb/GEZJ01004349.1/:2335-3810(+)